MPCQQDDLYRAEDLVWPRSSGRVLSVPDAQALVDGWRDLPWWQENFPNVKRVEVNRRDSARGGSAGRFHPTEAAGVIDMAPQHMTPHVLAHEVAHVLAEARYGSRSHDPWFARTYLQLVYLALGSETYKALYDAFEEVGVDHHIDE
jgi:putative metallohydrolase (TIGR04338 family)